MSLLRRVDRDQGSEPATRVLPVIPEVVVIVIVTTIINTKKRSCAHVRAGLLVVNFDINEKKNAERMNNRALSVEHMRSADKRAECTCRNRQHHLSPHKWLVLDYWESRESVR